MSWPNSQTIGLLGINKHIQRTCKSAPGASGKYVKYNQNLFVCLFVCLFVYKFIYLCIYTAFVETHLQSDQTTRTGTMMCIVQGSACLRFHWYYSMISHVEYITQWYYCPFRVSNSPSPAFWGANRLLQAKCTKKFKLSYFRKYCIDRNHILQSDKDHQVGLPFMSGTNVPPNKSKMAAAAILKNRKLLYLYNGVTDFDEI